MCPACISAAAIIAYGTGATAGTAALLIGVRSAWRRVLPPRPLRHADDAAPQVSGSRAEQP